MSTKKLHKLKQKNCRFFVETKKTNGNKRTPTHCFSTRGPIMSRIQDNPATSSAS